MHVRPFSCIIALAALLSWLAVPAAAQNFATATDKNPKPEETFSTPSRAVFDCAGRDTLALDSSFFAEISDSTTASENNLSRYACRVWSEEGPENIYRLEVAQALQLYASLRQYGDTTAPPDEDLDIFLLSDCDTDSCLAGENLEFSIQLPPGTYYLVVDGYGSSNPAQGFFTLLLECRELGVPLQICEPGGAIPIEPGVGVLSMDVNVYGQPNLIQTYACSPIVERGGEIWFAVYLEPYHEFTASTYILAGSLDAALWIFDGCGPDAQCLGFSDDKLAGQAESIVLANDSDAGITVYLGLDSYRNPSSDIQGEVTMQFEGVSNVPTEKQSLGSVRSLYR